MELRVRSIVALLALSLVAAACGSDSNEAEPTDDATPASSPGECPTDYAGAEVYPVFVSSEIVVGDRSRFLVGLLDSNDAPLSGDDLEMTATFASIDGSGSSSEARFEFIETVPSQNRGLFVSYPAFDEAGVWRADIELQGGGFDTQMAGCFQVTKTGSTPALGAPAPPSKVPTADDVQSLKEISTDTTPNPDFYTTTPAEAIKNAEPFVLVFATPKYCTSQTCGPTLDIVADAVKGYKDLTVIHSEIYKDLEPQNPVVPAVEEWGLPSEPWVFVVNSKGNVVAKYEGSVTAKELKPVLDAL